MQFPQDPRASTAAAEEELRERQRQEEDLANNMSVGGGVDANYYFILNRFRASFIGAMTFFFPRAALKRVGSGCGQKICY